MRVPARHSMDPWWAVAFRVGRALVFGAPPPACLCRSVVPFVPIFMRDSVCGGYSGVMREPARHLGSSLRAVYLEAMRPFSPTCPHLGPRVASVCHFLLFLDLVGSAMVTEVWCGYRLDIRWALGGESLSGLVGRFCSVHPRPFVGVVPLCLALLFLGVMLSAAIVEM